jgi:ParB-like chromosome segregation protein Spo0J
LTFRVAIDGLLFPHPTPRGMNPFVLMSLAHEMRQHRDPVGPPILVAQELGGRFRIVNGRHRVVASMIAGRDWIVAELDATEA